MMFLYLLAIVCLGTRLGIIIESFGMGGIPLVDKDFIKNRITQLRLAQNISEYQLSFNIGKSHGYIQSITSGESQMSLDSLYDLCEYYDMSLNEFFNPDVESSNVLRDVKAELNDLSEEQLQVILDVIAQMKK